MAPLRWGARGTAPPVLPLLLAASAAAPGAGTGTSGWAVESPSLARTSAESELLAAARAKLEAAPGSGDELQTTADAGPAPCPDASPTELRIDFTVFGVLGVGANDTSRVPPDVLNRARQWVIEAIMRTMLDDAHYGKSLVGDTGVRRSRTEAPKEQPTASVHVIEPFEEDKTLPPGVIDQRSAFLRTRWYYRFPGVPLCDAAEFAYRLCDRYPNDSKEFLASMLRALDMAHLYPIQALQIAARGLRDLVSFLHLGVSLVNAQQQQLENHGCNTEQRKAGSEEGFFFLPPCPKDSTSCYQNAGAPDLCSLEEQKQFGVCKCNFGFEGEITLPDMGAGGSFVGTCNKTKGYCQPGNEGEEGSWELAKAVRGSRRASGTVGEEVRPVCLQGFYPSGVATCVVESKDEGWYVPNRFCEAYIGARPVVPDCPTPVGDVVSKGCDACDAIEDEEDASKQRCECVVDCAPGFKEKGRPGGPQPRCTLKGFDCPPKLRWDKATGSCLTEAGERTMEFCCGEPWQQIPNNPDPTKLAMMPPPKLAAVGSCTDVRSISRCFSSAEVKDGRTSPCCWRQAGWGSEEGPKCAPEGSEQYGTKDLPAGQCAIERLVPLAEWRGLPQCVAKCKTPVVEHGTQTQCGDCVPGEDQEACPCTVDCSEGYWHLGGGATGLKKCGENREFGDMPICGQVPEPPVCPPLEAPLVPSAECKECRGGRPGCECTIACAAGHLLAKDSAHPEGKKECTRRPREVVAVKKCEELTSAEQCLDRQEERATGAPAAPCCWRAEGFGAGGPRCVALGSPQIHAGAWPDGYSGEGPIVGCAKMEEGHWLELPTCKPICDAAHFNQPGVVATSCQACFAGEDCPECMVACAEGYVRYGGGEIGNYRCSEQVVFGPPPVCRKPEAGEDGGLAPLCEAPVVADADVRLCSGCHAGLEDECACDVSCLPRFKNILQDVPVGAKKCHKVPATHLVPVDDCGQAVDEPSCVQRTQGGAACCWVPAPGDGAGGRCLARGSAQMAAAPASCARVFAASWDPMPQCEPLCETSSLDLDGRHNLRRDLLVGCEDCTADHPCTCEATCDEGSIRIGGGPEGPRRCTKSALRFEDAPLCRAKPPPARCEQAVIGTSHPTGSLVFSGAGCSGCEAGKDDCTCDVACASGFKEADGASEGGKACKAHAIGVEVDMCEAPGVECLKSKEKDGTPCCSRESGFGEDGKHGNCLRRGDPRIALTTPPDECAATSEGRWDPFPNCQALCIWAGSQFLSPTGCDDCFRDPQFGACGCEAKCVPGAGPIDESAGLPPWKFQCGPDGRFAQGPNCVPAVTNEERFCERPSDDDGARTVSAGCGGCSNKGGNCDCEVRCAAGYKLMSGEAGPKACLKGEYDCPRTTKWVAESRVCQDAADGRSVDVACCPEFVFKDIEEFQPVTVDCTAYTTADECLKEEETGKKRACCFQEKGFGKSPDAPKCVAAGSEQIGPWSDTTSPASACWNRPPVSSALWDKPLPKCSRKCIDIFTPMRGIKATGCDDCVADDPTCTCTVTCAEDAAYYGGPPQGAKACKLTPGSLAPAFEPAPVCAKLEERALSCARPEGEGLVVQGCQGCSALSRGPVAGCSCRLQCERGFLPEGGRTTTGDKSCKQEPMELTERPCMELTGISDASRDACLSSQQKNAAGELMPCCYSDRGWARDDAQTVVTCAMMGDPRAYDAPQACAVPFKAVFLPPPPACKRECKNRFDFWSTNVVGCRDCFLGGPCSCSVQCQTGYEYRGGGEVGDRTCREDPDVDTKASFGVTPLCARPESVGSCKPLDKKMYDAEYACTWCETDQQCDRCQVKCNQGFVWDKNPQSPEGNVVCSSEPKPSEDNKCESFGDASKCTAHMEGDKACCWQAPQGAEAGACFPIGDPRFVRVPKCATTRQPVWKGLPSCVPVCKFVDPPTTDRRISTALGNVEVSAGCARCAPGKPCPECTVSCRAGTEHFGGGPVGNRACSDTAAGDVPAGVFPMKPLCWQPEPAPTCPKPITASAWTGPRGLAPDAGIVVVSGCDGCTPNSADDCCVMRCATGYQLQRGSSDIGDVQCEDLPGTSPYSPQDKPCSAYTTQEACGTAVEWEDTQRTKARPCCWRKDRFVDGAQCAGKGSAAITLSFLPDADGNTLRCAPMKSAAYSKVPACEPVCSNSFRSISVTAQDCDGCTAWRGTYEAFQPIKVYSEPSGAGRAAGNYEAGKRFDVDQVPTRRAAGERFVWGRIGEGKWVQLVNAQTGEEFAKKVGSTDCKCAAKCSGDYRLLPSSGHPEGARVCRLDYSTNVASFEAAPECALACPNPDHDRGTRSITGGCKGDSFCLAGDASCQCMVDCREGSERVGGNVGQQVCTKGRSLAPSYPQLPTCNPQCRPPNDQGGALDTSRCTSVCDARDTMQADRLCKCIVQCATNFKRTAGAPEGTFRCLFVPGTADVPARAEWRHETWTESMPVGMPLCIVEFWVTVVDAQTGDALKGATVTLYTDGSRRTVFDAPVTDRRGMVKFAVDFPSMELKVVMEDYMDIQRTVKRSEVCSDVRNCGVKISLAKRLEDGELVVQKDNCYLATKKRGMIQFRATLEWAEKDMMRDLDLWARYWDCGHDIEKRYGCAVEQNPIFVENTGKNWESATCFRHEFGVSNAWRNIEGGACTLADCEKTNGATKIGKDGKPVCNTKWPNEFQKWINFGARSARNLEKRVSGRGEEAQLQTPQDMKAVWDRPEWPSDNFMVLDVDATMGSGPETITFNHVPPGTYQLAVGKFSDEIPSIDYGNPRITLRLGSNAVFECRIPKSCRAAADHWNAVNVRISDESFNRLENIWTYRIEILDSRDTMKKIAVSSIPATKTPTRIAKRNHPKFGWQEEASYYDPITPFSSDTSQEVVDSACLGECDVQQGDRSVEFRKCIPRLAKRASRQAGLNMSERAMSGEFDV